MLLMVEAAKESFTQRLPLSSKLHQVYATFDFFKNGLSDRT